MRKLTDQEFAEMVTTFNRQGAWMHPDLVACPVCGAAIEPGTECDTCHGVPLTEAELNEFSIPADDPNP